MMDKGILPKTSYIKVTPEMVKETFIDAMFDEAGGGKYLRLFNIMKSTENNYNLISKGLNKMLGIAPIAIGAAAIPAAISSRKAFKKGGSPRKSDKKLVNYSNFVNPQSNSWLDKY
jgi:hypothetical protein